ncbi:MAG: M23 family peptidase, partial [Rhodobacter sp.]|nr:M23 family peptidase [Rhodobacter sp.]
MIRGLVTALVLCAAPAASQPLRLDLPIDCVIGDSCFVQNYVDRDPGPGAVDFACHGLTYDGHQGTDIALTD